MEERNGQIRARIQGQSGGGGAVAAAGERGGGRRRPGWRRFLTTVAMDEVTKSAWCCEPGCTRWNSGELEVVATQTLAARGEVGTPKSPRMNTDATRNSNANCVAKTRLWPRRQRCWCYQKNSRRSSTGGTRARTNDRTRRSPTNGPRHPAGPQRWRQDAPRLRGPGINVRTLQRRAASTTSMPPGIGPGPSCLSVQRRTSSERPALRQPRPGNAMPATSVLATRHRLYTAPARWSRYTRNWTPIGVVTLNPERDGQ